FSHMNAKGVPPRSLIRSIQPAFGSGQAAQRAFTPIQVYLDRVLGLPMLQPDDPLIVSPGYHTDIDRCISDDPSIPVTSLPTYDLTEACDTSVNTTARTYNATIEYGLSDTLLLKL